MLSKISVNHINPPNGASLPRTASLLLIALLIAIVCGIGATVVAQHRSGQTPASRLALAQQSGSTDAANVMFRSGRDLITEQQWSKAQEKFNQYITAFPNEKNIDAALYWKAYSESKLAKYDQCRSTVGKLFADYPSTSWREDARLLLAQLPGSVTLVTPEAVTPMLVDGDRVAITVPPSPLYAPMAPMAAAQAQLADSDLWRAAGGSNADDNDPCEFKIVVLQALFQTDLQRGITAATEWLKPGSTQTVRCKGAALNLLGRNGGKAVTPVILNFAKNEPDIKLRARAISALGATNDDSVIDSLRDFALNSQENEIVEASLYALSRHTGERAIMVLSEIATSAKVPAQRKMAISSIASRPGEPAVDALLRIYDADQTIEIRKSVIAGFGNRKSERAGVKLMEIARTSDNVELRKSAISAISRRGGDKVIDNLLSLYDVEKSEELKDQILNALASGSVVYAGGQVAIAGSGSRVNDQRVIRKLIEIARNPQTPMDRRRRAIGLLSRSKDPEVLRFLEELLK